ncbi:hypothetical protein K437DRAFT_255539 [Tilletiaria anomala UBC 951]|uniref:Nucleoside transporter n=1 Tax=Tilletiaria anomala (strain ATCC 24038 / CBS 436.72 / UBC 951) TaxID=1037660 RepID=A0A066W3Z5_TILAU|nr:uncharacterized protein K437DRAFT_255539 [Tilletiaria anomala UBC 951]KDN48431.1 hypothetical protein K437DRAFT_255539 [Tilletiaria anomala UBC 951]
MLNAAEYRQLPGEEAAAEVFEDGTPESVEVTGRWQILPMRQKVLVYFQFGLLGAGVLLPFNALITPSEYFRACFASTKYANNFASWIVVGYNATTIVFSAHATATLEKTTPQARITRSGLCILGSLLAFTLSTFIVTQANSGTAQLYFAFVILLSIFMAAATAYFQNATVALSARFGPLCMGSMLSFQGVVGALISLVQLIAALSFVKVQSISTTETVPIDAETIKSATAFFTFTTVLMAIVLTSFRILTRTRLYAEVATKDAAAMQEAAIGASRPISSLERLVSVQRKISSLCFSIASVFGITLCLFPALTSRVTSSSAKPGTSLASPLIFSAVHFLVFNTLDVVGRTIPSLVPPKLILERGWIFILSALTRIAFVPLFKLGHLQTTHAPPAEPSDSLDLLLSRAKNDSVSILQADWVFFLLLSLFAISNGYLSTSLFLAAPNHPQLRVDERQPAATILSFWLTIGLAIGSALSFTTSNW